MIKKIIKATAKSVEHWDRNIISLERAQGKTKYWGEKLNRWSWFDRNCMASSCPLCRLLLTGNNSCNGCPLDDTNKLGDCCKEWRILVSRARAMKPIKRNVKAVRDRIKRELDKASEGML